MPRRTVLGEDDEVMRRCRRVREELYQRFKTPEEMHAWLLSLERQADTRRGAKPARRRTPSKGPASAPSCRAASHAR